MQSDATVIYFAYGSNMCAAWIERIIGLSKLLDIAHLNGYILKWNKRSNDESGKANLEFTGAETDSIWGVLYSLSLDQMAKLSKREIGYHPREITVRSPNGKRYTAVTFVAIATNIDDSLQPNDWYKRIVVHGGEQHGLPGDYMAILESQSLVEDPDRERAKQNLWICGLN